MLSVLWCAGTSVCWLSELQGVCEREKMFAPGDLGDIEQVYQALLRCQSDEGGKKLHLIYIQRLLGLHFDDYFDLCVCFSLLGTLELVSDT